MLSHWYLNAFLPLGTQANLVPFLHQTRINNFSMESWFLLVKMALQTKIWASGVQIRFEILGFVKPGLFQRAELENTFFFFKGVSSY